MHIVNTLDDIKRENKNDSKKSRQYSSYDENYKQP